MRRHFNLSPSTRLSLLVLFSLLPRTTRTLHVFSYVLSLKIVLSLLGLSSSVLVFGGFSVIIVLLRGASMEHECVVANVDEEGP